MAQILHVACRHCGEPLKNRSEPYCPACNLYLCYRAMPILFGMILTGRLAPDLADLSWSAQDVPLGYDDENALAME
jgi:hypothetical protein